MSHSRNTDNAVENNEAGSTSALRALTSSNRQIGPYHWFRGAPRPELKSDLNAASELHRASNGTTSTSSSALSSVFSSVDSRNTSADSSPANSADVGKVINEALSSQSYLPNSQDPSTPAQSRFSTASLDQIGSNFLKGQPDGGGLDVFAREGAIYKLVQGSAKLGILCGVVDIRKKEAIHDNPSYTKLNPFSFVRASRFWFLIDKPREASELYDQQRKNQQKEENAKILTAEPLDAIAKIIITSYTTTPPSSRRPSGTSLTSSCHHNIVHPSLSPNKAIYERPTNNIHTVRPSTSSTITSWHTANSLHRRSDSSISLDSPALPPLPITASIDSLISPSNNESTDSLCALPPQSPTRSIPPWRQRSSWNSDKSTSSHSSTEEEIHPRKEEPFSREIRVFHPAGSGVASFNTIIAIALFDSQSDYSYVSPQALEELGIDYDECVKPAEHSYRTNSGELVVAKGKIDLTWRDFTTEGKLHTNTFYLAGDDAPYSGVLLGKDHLLPKNRPARMEYKSFVNVRERKTAEARRAAAKAKKDHNEVVRENNKRKEERKKEAEARQQSGGSSHSTTNNDNEQR